MKLVRLDRQETTNNFVFLLATFEKWFKKKAITIVYDKKNPKKSVIVERISKKGPIIRTSVLSAFIESNKSFKEF